MSEEGEGQIITIPSKAPMGIMQTTFLFFSISSILIIVICLPFVSAYFLIRKYGANGVPLIAILAIAFVALYGFEKGYLMASLCSAYFIPYFFTKLALGGFRHD